MAAASAASPDSGSLFAPERPITAPIENESNLPPHDVLVDTGTDVVGADGDPVGSVDRVLFDAGGAIEGFTVTAGVLFKHDVTIPLDLVADLGRDRIRLKVTGHQAERRQTGVGRREQRRAGPGRTQTGLPES